ncbi:hypothetical protein EDB87DRAFT_1821720 [Lactarius vividus]|nr:hypothetical protein EDB87DRAFT_1821720 [Lactarius vividus]
MDYCQLQRVAVYAFKYGIFCVFLSANCFPESDLLFACSPFVRDRMYSFYFPTHVTCVVVALFAIYMHYPPTLPYLLGAMILYAFDYIARIARTRYTTTWLTTESAHNGGTTLVDRLLTFLPSVLGGMRASACASASSAIRGSVGGGPGSLVARDRSPSPRHPTLVE